MENLFYIGFFALCCIDQYALFTTVSIRNKVHEMELRLRKNAYILSIKASMLLLSVGLYNNYLFYQSGFDIGNYIGNLTLYQTFLLKLSSVYFASYLFMDCYLGSIHYPKYMTSLSGYTHHIIYIFISCIAWYYEIYPIMLLFMVAELPTYLLSIGQYNKQYRNDNLFGITFFLTRILYHVFLLTKLTYSLLFMFFGNAVLLLHTYWFTTWIKKYGRGQKTKQI